MNSYSTVTRRTYETWRRFPDVVRSASQRDSLTQTARILDVGCPRCEAEPGQWCEYASNRVKSGMFQSLHNERHYRAAERLKMVLVGLEVAWSMMNPTGTYNEIVMRAVRKVEQAAAENRIFDLWWHWTHDPDEKED